MKFQIPTTVMQIGIWNFFLDFNVTKMTTCQN